MDVAEAAFRLSRGCVEAATSKWPQINADFEIIHANEKDMFVPLDCMVAVTSKRGRDLSNAGKWAKTASTYWPGAYSSTAANEEAEPQMEGDGDGPAEIASCVLWDYKEPAFNAIWSLHLKLNPDSPRFVLAATIEEEICNGLSGNWLHTLVKRCDEGPEHVRTMRDAIVCFCDELDAHPLSEKEKALLPKLDLVVQLFHGYRGMIESCPGAFNNTSSDDVEFVVPLAKSAEGTLAKSGLKSGPALAFLQHSLPNLLDSSAHLHRIRFVVK
jgi:hypothetical protein